VLLALTDVDAPDGVRDGVQQARAETETFGDCGDGSSCRKHTMNLNVRMT
jgi:hypothetical protein